MKLRKIENKICIEIKLIIKKVFVYKMNFWDYWWRIRFCLIDNII